MLIACKCLNITLKLTANNLPSAMPIAASISNYDDIAYKTKSPNANQAHMVSSTSVQNHRDHLEDNHEDQPPYIQCSTAENLDCDQLQFFRTAKLSTASLIAPTIQHTNLIGVTLIENWNLNTCRLCKTITHAQANDSAKTLINPTLWTNQEKINIIKSQKSFSKSFNILLSPKSTEIDSTMIDAGNFKALNSNSSTSTDRTKQLRQYLSNVIQTETEATEDRIDRYKKQQMATLKAFREKAEQDFYDILRAIEEDASIKAINSAVNESTNDTLTGNLSANSKLLSDLTPPVTPDSTPMSIGNSPNFKQQPQSFLLLNQNLVTKKHATKIKHSTPDKVQQRYSNADDDIFFDMDGLDCRDSVHHMTQSDDEDVDDDEDFEDSYASRNSGVKITPTLRKSGSKMIVAQSLPMAVPNFNQRNEDDYEEYADRQDNVDIAASIKALAQSVHGEAIFGDLPKPRFSTQI